MAKRKSLCWDHVHNKGEGTSTKDPKVECKYCSAKFHGGATRILFHLLGVKNKGVQPCSGEIPDKVLKQLQTEWEGRQKTAKTRGGVKAIEVATSPIPSSGAARTPRQSTLAQAFNPLLKESV